MTEPNNVLFLVNDKRSTSVTEEHDRVQGLTLEDLQNYIYSDLTLITGPAGPPGSDGAAGPPGVPGAAGAPGPIGTTVLYETKYVETLMRTPLDIYLGPTGTTSISITEGTTTPHGTLSSVVSNVVTFTPKSRVPHYPSTSANDMFTYTGVYNGETVVGIVHINIRIATPTNKYLATTGGGSLYAGKYIGSTITEVQVTDVSSWNDMIATNNVDGIVLHADSSGVIRYWDPVDGATGSLNISSYINYAANYGTTEAATFDNKNGFLYIFSGPTTGSPSTVWFYRIGFETFETGGSLVVSNIDAGAIYDSVTLDSAVEEDNFGDVAWDPLSQRIWASSDTRLWYINTRSWGLSSSLNNDPPYIANYQFSVNTSFTLSQLSFSYDGTIFLRYQSSGNTLSTVDVRSISSTTIGNPGVTYTDLATWPVTLDESFV